MRPPSTKKSVPGLGEDTVIGGGLLVKRMPEGEAALYSQTTIVLGRSESDILDYQKYLTVILHFFV